MKSILLIGLNNFGILLAKQFNALGHQVMAVDKEEERVNAVGGARRCLLRALFFHGAKTRGQWVKLLSRPGPSTASFPLRKPEWVTKGSKAIFGWISQPCFGPA